MTEAEQERAAVVAFIHSIASCYNEAATRTFAHDAKCAHERAEISTIIARSIERGDHLKGGDDARDRAYCNHGGSGRHRKPPRRHTGDHR